jgi:hypothetical protein
MWQGYLIRHMPSHASPFLSRPAGGSIHRRLTGSSASLGNVSASPATRALRPVRVVRGPSAVPHRPQRLRSLGLSHFDRGRGVSLAFPHAAPRSRYVCRRFST